MKSIAKLSAVILTALSLTACDGAVSIKQAAFNLSGGKEAVSKLMSTIKHVSETPTKLTPKIQVSLEKLKNDEQALPKGVFSSTLSEIDGECRIENKSTVTITSDLITMITSLDMECPDFGINASTTSQAMANYTIDDGIITTTYISGSKGIIPPKIAVVMSTSDTLQLVFPRSTAKDENGDLLEFEDILSMDIMELRKLETILYYRDGM